MFLSEVIRDEMPVDYQYFVFLPLLASEIGQDRWMIGIGPIAKELLAPSVPNGEGIVD
jgi:hypothetical protein